MKFSEKLIKLRKENKLSQEQLASKLDVSRQAVSKWESGQTYPEMDKLLSLCKLFKCSLDDLTNDEISKDEMSNNQNKKNSFINFIYEMLEFINKSISMLRAMTFKEIIKMGFELFLLCIFLFILRIPFALILDTGWSLLWSIDISHDFIFIVGNMAEFLINTIYLILFAIIFIYIYKVRYLDKYEETEEVIVKYIREKKDEKEEFIEEVKDKKNNKKEIKVEEKVIIKKDNSRSFALFNILGTIMKYIIKFIVICIGMPLVFTLAVIGFLLIIDVVLTFKGIIFIGILLGLIFALIFNIMLVEVIFKFIFNMHINLKKIFAMFIISVIGLGVSVGVLTLEATTLKFYDEVPKEIQTETIKKELKMKNNTYILFDNYEIDCYSSGECEYYTWDWEYDIEKKYDDSLKDKVKVEILYYNDYTKVEVNEINNSLEISKYNITDYNTVVKLGNIILKKLKNKEIYNYDSYSYTSSKIVITTSKANHEILDKNLNTHIEKIKKEELENMRNSYNQQINEYENKIEKLNNQIYEWENKYNNLEVEKNEEIEKLKEEIEMYKEKINEYKEKIANLIEE